MEEAQLKYIIRKITEQVMNRLIAEGKYIPESDGVLTVVPNFITEVASLNIYLKEHYHATITCALFEEVSSLDRTFEIINTAKKEQQQQLLASLKFYNEVVLAMPALSLLKRIAEGDDTGLVEQIILRAILLEKKVTVVLDYVPPKFKRGTFFESILNAINALEDMGVEIVSLQSSLKSPLKEYCLVTEAEVISAHQSGELTVRCAKGAIITPLAKDKAKELGITIE